MTMMCLLPIQFPPLPTSFLIKVLMVEVPHIACCFQAGLMGLTQKEMHLFQPWKLLTCSIELLSAYKRLPPIRCHQSDASIPTTVSCCKSLHYVKIIIWIQKVGLWDNPRFYSMREQSELVSLTWVYCIYHYSSGAGRWPVGCLFSCSH
jgi:hypothetical protein